MLKFHENLKITLLLFSNLLGPNYHTDVSCYRLKKKFTKHCIKYAKMWVFTYARKSLLFNGQQIWIKKEGRLFDVTLGAFDGAEVCEAVGNFLLYQLSKNYNKKDIGLFRDDGLVIFKNDSGSKAGKIKKDIQKSLKVNPLDITIKCNLKTANYLDVIFNLPNATHRLFCKPKNEITYIHKESNHPPSQGKYPYLSNLVFLNIHLTKKYLKNLHKFIRKL